MTGTADTTNLSSLGNTATVPSFGWPPSWFWPATAGPIVLFPLEVTVSPAAIEKLTRSPGIVRWIPSKAIPVEREIPMALPTNRRKIKLKD